MKKSLLTLTAFALLHAGAAMAGTITVNNLSAITVPQTRVYKTCLGAISGQTFGSLAAYTGTETQTRTSLISGGCAWAREVGIEPRYISCATPGIIPSDPAQIIVNWTGTNADDLECSISVIE